MRFIFGALLSIAVLTFVQAAPAPAGESSNTSPVLRPGDPEFTVVSKHLTFDPETEKYAALNDVTLTTKQLALYRKVMVPYAYGEHAELSEDADFAVSDLVAMLASACAHGPKKSDDDYARRFLTHAKEHLHERVVETRRVRYTPLAQLGAEGVENARIDAEIVGLPISNIVLHEKYSLEVARWTPIQAADTFRDALLLMLQMDLDDLTRPDPVLA